MASQPQTVSCAAPAALGQYDKYCEGLQAEYFLLPKQSVAPSLTNLTPNVTSFVTSINATVSQSNIIRHPTSSSSLLQHLSNDHPFESRSLVMQAAAMSLKGVNQLVAAKTHSFAVRYTGVFFVDQMGEYQFTLNSPAGTALTVSNHTLTFNEGSNSR